MTLIACSRMYNVTATARCAWASLFERIGETSGIDLEIVDHPAPAPLEELWVRPDMGCVFMCGWPFSRAEPQPQLIAAPVPAAERYQGRPVYFTDLIARRDSGFRSLEDSFGGRIGWTVEASHSGFNALRHHLLGYRSKERPRLYRDSVGPLLTPAGALACVVEGRADVAPLDSYALDLIRRHEPKRLDEVMVVESTPAAPIPPLVASPGIDALSRTALRKAFQEADRDPALTALLQELGLTGFAAIKRRDYEIAESRAQEAVAAGYLRPE